MKDLAACFCNRLRETGALPLPAPDLPPHAQSLHWENHLFKSPLFRRAHVEMLEIPSRFSIMHVCILPQLGDVSPIFGFDMIAGKKKVTGIFVDFSPVTSAPPVPALGDIIDKSTRARYLEPRSTPTWGDIFSSDFFAVRPSTGEEVIAAITAATKSFTHYLMHLQGTVTPDAEIVAGQAAYASAQRQNPHTVRVLTQYVGAFAARRFVDEVLFPLPY